MKYADVRWMHRDWDDPFEYSEELVDAAGNRYCLEIQHTVERGLLAIRQTYDVGSNFPVYQILVELPTNLELTCFLADKEHP